jgi:tellurite resistance protein
MTHKPPPALIHDVVDVCIKRFDQGEYNPTPLIDLGAMVANADGKVEPEELAGLCGILEPMLGADLDDELVGFLVNASAKTIAAYGIAPRMRVTAQILEDCDLVEQGITVALAVAFAGKGLGAPERAVIEQLADTCELPRADLETLIEKVRTAYAAPK